MEFDGGATFLEPVPCALSAEQFHVPELKGELHCAGDLLDGRRRRGGRTISSSLSVNRCSSSALRGRSSACAARALGVGISRAARECAEAGSGSVSSVSNSFVACDSSFSVRVESPSSRV